MKKVSLFTLVFVLVAGCAFASASGFFTEEYSTSVSMFENEDGYFATASAGALYNGGLKTDSDVFNLVSTLDLGVVAGRERGYYDGNDVYYDVYLSPSIDFNGHYGMFGYDLGADFDYMFGKDYEAGDAGSYKANGIGGSANAAVNLVIPVSAANDYFVLDLEGLAGIDKVTNYYNKTDINGDVDYIKVAYADADFDFGYYLPTDKNTDNWVLRKSIDPKNDFRFYANTYADFFAYGNRSEIDFMADINSDFVYNWSFAKNNVITIGVGCTESLMLEKCRGEKTLVGMNTLDATGKFEYLFKTLRGVNAHDYFKMETALTGDARFELDSKRKTLILGTTLDAYVPRLIPVELLDNFSLSVPAEFNVGLKTAIKRTTFTGTFDYCVELVPFYMEVKNGARFLNMYLNTVELNACYAEEYNVGKDLFKLAERTLNANFVIGLDNEKGNNVSNAAAITAELEHDFIYKTNYVTIGFSTEF